MLHIISQVKYEVFHNLFFMDLLGRIELSVNYLINSKLYKYKQDVGFAMGYKSAPAFSNILTGKVNIPKNFITKLCSLSSNLNEDWIISGDGEMILNNIKHDKDHNSNSTKNSVNNNFVKSVDKYVYESLPFISMKARASFAELGQILGETGELFKVIKTDPSEHFPNQIVVEIDGDSMEPVLFSGTKVRCKEIDQSDWVYLNSGVYAIAYGNFFVVKRIKSSPVDGILTLSSDNIETGGSLNVPLNEVRKIWKVLRIVDAPIR